MSTLHPDIPGSFEHSPVESPDPDSVAVVPGHQPACVPVDSHEVSSSLPAIPVPDGERFEVGHAYIRVGALEAWVPCSPYGLSAYPILESAPATPSPEQGTTPDEGDGEDTVYGNGRAYIDHPLGAGKASLKLWKHIELGLHGHGMAFPLALTAFGPVATAGVCGFIGLPVAATVIVSIFTLLVLGGLAIVIIVLFGKPKKG